MAKTRVLIVLDGSRFSFADASMSEENYTISYLLKTLAANPALTITTAHRRSDPLLALPGRKPAIAASAHYEKFNFATTAPLSDFDMLWLIGDEGVGPSGGTPIDEDENVAIAAFMEDGGGVYATGDHSGIGSCLCGRLPRVRTMRKWYDGGGDQPADIPAGWKPNWPPFGPTRADTTQMGAGTKFYFDGQSDAIPQPLMLPMGPHPVLQGPLGPITRFPDHMHEGEAIVPWDFGLTVKFSGADPIVEYPIITLPQEKPAVIATGQIIGNHGSFLESDGSYMGHSGATDTAATVAKTLGILCAYDGWKAGVGRVLTDSSFHHIIDLNLIGNPVGGTFDVAFNVDSHLGFTPVPAVLDDMRAFFNNTTVWLARPPRALTFLVDKSTFGWDEVSAHPGGVFDKAFYVVVDGLKPSDFPGGPLDEIIDPAAPTPAQLAKLANWAPSVSTPPTGISFTPIGVTSDDLTLPPRVQRFTFAYRLTISDMSLFLFPGSTEILNLIAVLSVLPDPGIAWAQIELIKDADPYFSNYANGNITGWLSSDLRVLKVVEGEAPFGLALGSTPADARAFIAHAIDNMTPAVFDALPTDEKTSALSILGTTLGPGPKAVFNFALARVRLQGSSLPADPVRVFFRVFQSPTTASLTYETDMSGNPIQGYRQAASGGYGGHKIALLGISADGWDYTSIPCFAAPRVPNTVLANNMTTQTDPKNVRAMAPTGAEQQFFYGAWLDTNQATPGLFPSTPFAQPNADGPFKGKLEPILTSLLMGVHQCLVAEIVFDGSPILSYSTPANSDKLAQRNIAYTTVSNPGTATSRTATHSFEIRPSPVALDRDHRPDELMIDWGNLPAGTTASIYLPAVNAADVVAMADAMYAAHGLTALDAHTLAVPVGGITFMPIPKSGGLANYAGLISLELPAGIVKGQRFDAVVRQITTTGLQMPFAPAAVIARQAAREAAARGAALTFSGGPMWQKVVGAFQIAIPVSTKADMLVPEARTLSVLRWIGASLSANSRWYPVFDRYLGTLAARVRGLGGDPDTIPPTPDGLWPALIDGAAAFAAATPSAAAPAAAAPVSASGGGGRAQPDAVPTITGKIDAIVYDRFGDFEAFVLETAAGDLHRYLSREPRVLALVRRAWEERITVTVSASPQRPHRPLEIVLHGAWQGRA